MLVAEAPAVLVGDNESEIPSGGSFKIGSFINSFLSAPASFWVQVDFEP